MDTVFVPLASFDDTHRQTAHQVIGVLVSLVMFAHAAVGLASGAVVPGDAGVQVISAALLRLQRAHPA
jgi:hypothetical protein